MDKKCNVLDCVYKIKCSQVCLDSKIYGFGATRSEVTDISYFRLWIGEVQDI